MTDILNSQVDDMLLRTSLDSIFNEKILLKIEQLEMFDDMCWGLNSHCYPMLGMVINPIVGFTHHKASVLKVGWPCPYSDFSPWHTGTYGWSMSDAVNESFAWYHLIRCKSSLLSSPSSCLPPNKVIKDVAIWVVPWTSPLERILISPFWRLA